MLGLGSYGSIWNSGLGGVVANGSLIRVGQHATNTLTFQFAGPGNRYVEVPPPVRAGAERAYIFTYARSVRGTNPLVDLTAVMAGGTFNVETSPLATLISWGNNLNPADETYIAPGSVDLINSIWKRNYEGVYSELPDGLGNLIRINHCESKNETISAVQYPLALTADGSPLYTGEPNNWYSAFISGTTVPVASALGPGTDHGPILWPATPYIAANSTFLNWGLRHPSAIVVGDEHFIFYLDHSKGTDGAGTGAGVKLAKAPLATAGQSGAYHTYFNGAWADAALPVGYSAANVLPSLKVGGGRSSVIASTDGGTIRFSPAKVKNLALFVAAHEYIDGGGALHVYVWTSIDLINWMGQVEVATYPTWAAGRMHYIKMLSADFNSNTEVDASGFYLVGGTTSTSSFEMPWIKVILDLPWAPKQLRRAALDRACTLLLGRVLNAAELQFWATSTEDISVPMLLQRYVGQASFLEAA